MEIGGKYNDQMITRCCPAGKWKFQRLSSTGASSCQHFGWCEFWDFLDWRTLKPATEEMIKEAEEQEKNMSRGIRCCDFFKLSKESQLKHYDEDRKEEVAQLKKEIEDFIASVEEIPESLDSINPPNDRPVEEDDLWRHFNIRHSQEAEDKLRELWREGMFNGHDTEKWKTLQKEYDDLLKRR